MKIAQVSSIALIVAALPVSVDAKLGDKTKANEHLPRDLDGRNPEFVTVSRRIRQHIDVPEYSGLTDCRIKGYCIPNKYIADHTVALPGEHNGRMLQSIKISHTNTATAYADGRFVDQVFVYDICFYILIVGQESANISHNSEAWCSAGQKGAKQSSFPTYSENNVLSFPGDGLFLPAGAEIRLGMGGAFMRQDGSVDDDLNRQFLGCEDSFGGLPDPPGGLFDDFFGSIIHDIMCFLRSIFTFGQSTCDNDNNTGTPPDDLATETCTPLNNLGNIKFDMELYELPNDMSDLAVYQMMRVPYVDVFLKNRNSPQEGHHFQVASEIGAIYEYVSTTPALDRWNTVLYRERNGAIETLLDQEQRRSQLSNNYRLDSFSNGDVPMNVGSSLRDLPIAEGDTVGIYCDTLRYSTSITPFNDCAYWVAVRVHPYNSSKDSIFKSADTIRPADREAFCSAVGPRHTGSPMYTDAYDSKDQCLELLTDEMAVDRW